MSLSKMIMGQSGNQGSGSSLDVDDVFKTFVYTGNNSSQTITNNIDLSGEGGLVWLKKREGFTNHCLFDTVRGGTHLIRPDTNFQSNDAITSVTFNSNGFQINNGNERVNQSGSSNDDYVSFTFRKTENFFDVVTWQGDDTTSRAINHSLGTTPGFIAVKRTNATGDWECYHRKLNGGTDPHLRKIQWNGSGEDEETYTNNEFGNTAPTSSTFHVGGSLTNNSTGQYLAYVFAHHDGTGTFGPQKNADIIKCGNYTGNSNGVTVDLGFEPQWVMIKNAVSGNSKSSWFMQDMMRGMVAEGADASDKTLYVNLATKETLRGDFSNTISAIQVHPTPTGFTIPSTSNIELNTSGNNYIFVAIRRGPLAAPTSASQVFNTNPAVGASGNLGQHRSGFPVDFALQKRTNTTSDWEAGARLIEEKSLRPNSTNTDSNSSGFRFDFMDGWSTGSADSNRTAWMWKRAPKYFDVVTYTGTGSSLNVNHNLGVVPEMIWLKDRDNAYPWIVQGSVVSSDNSKRLELGEATGLTTTNGGITALSSTTFTVGTFNNINTSSANIIAFLFSSVSGICKIGTYTGNGSTQTIDCGFSNGSKLVIVKRTDTGGNGNWVVMDSVRGINAGDDPTVSINVTNSNDPFDLINPQNSGFEVEEHSGSSVHKINTNGATYFFYAIAA